MLCFRLRALVISFTDFPSAFIFVSCSTLSAVKTRGRPVRLLRLGRGTGFGITTSGYLVCKASELPTYLANVPKLIPNNYFFVIGLIRINDIQAKPTATGDMQSTLTQVMTGQIDVGFAAPPIGLQQVEDGKIRIIARASDIPSTRNQTVRTLIVNVNKLAQNRELISRFVQAYAETIDWMYSDPRALEAYRVYSGTPERLTRKVMQEFYLKEMLDPYRISGLNAVMEDAVSFKFLREPLSKEQLSELFQVPARAK